MLYSILLRTGFWPPLDIQLTTVMESVFILWAPAWTPQTTPSSSKWSVQRWPPSSVGSGLIGNINRISRSCCRSISWSLTRFLKRVAPPQSSAPSPSSSTTTTTTSSSKSTVTWWWRPAGVYESQKSSTGTPKSPKPNMEDSPNPTTGMKPVETLTLANRFISFLFVFEFWCMISDLTIFQIQRAKVCCFQIGML